MGIAGPHTKEWFDRAAANLVLGVSSQYRYWGDDDTVIIDRGEGAHVWDMDGTRYLDYRLGYGPIILGHGHRSVADAVSEAAADGTVFALTQRREVEAAEAFLEAVGWADRMRFTNTGTEATMHAIRIARGFTGRELIVKLEGQYHGMHDYVLWSTAGAGTDGLGSKRDPIRVAGSSGIPESIRATVRVAPYNDLDALERVFRSDGARIAAVLVEPILGNSFAIMPEDGYLDGIRRICDEHGALLIFDEVKTGFRVGRGGAAELFDITPDIGTYAKALGNGFPVAALAFRQDIADALVPGEIAQAGTYGGNGIAVAAAQATLQELATGGPYERIERVGRSLMEGIAKLLENRGVPGHVLGVPAMFGISLSDEPPRDYRETDNHDADRYEELMLGLIRRGVFPDTDAREPWFLCAAMTDEDVATTLTALEESLDETLS